jgi:UDP-N-acetylmuramyl pentapeptide phosphotransferase/UDP-N-acetylglucosamine-1-phosphate transferase
MEILDQLFDEDMYRASILIGAFILAFIITYLAIPSIVTVAHSKKLYDVPNGRASHTKVTPVLGGIAVFAGLIISTIIFSLGGFDHELNCIIAGLIILFFFGIKDDILVLDPKKKLMAQIIAALIVAMLGDIRITNFHGLLGIEEINYVVSVCITVFAFIVIINSFNLIDGIDGLSSGVGIMTSGVFGGWFIISDHTSHAVMCFALAGSLLAFFRFNVFGQRNKIFLGDTGSLILGLSISVFAIRFMEYEVDATGIAIVTSAPAVAFGILIIPLFDTLRVFTLRVLQQKSPFIADKQHVHHRLLQLGFSHLEATSILLVINVLFIILSFQMQWIGNHFLLLTIITIASVLSMIMMKFVNRKMKEIKSGQIKVVKTLDRHASIDLRMDQNDKQSTEDLHPTPNEKVEHDMV